MNIETIRLDAHAPRSGAIAGLRALIIAIALVAPSANTAKAAMRDGAWGWVTDPIASRRDASAVLDPKTHRMMLFGGWDGSTDFNQTWQLDLPVLVLFARNWQLVVANGPPPSPRHGHRAVWDSLRSRMLVVGGYDGGYTNDVWELDMTPTPAWHLVPALGTKPLGRTAFGLALDPIRDRLILVGGVSGNPPDTTPTYLNDVWELPLSGPSALTWALLAAGGTPPTGRGIYSMRYDPRRDRMVMFGGLTAGGPVNDLWTLELAGAPQWVQLPSVMSAPSPRSDHVMVYDPTNDRMLVYGGYDGSVRDDLWALPLQGWPQWSRLSPVGAPPEARAALEGVFEPLGHRMVFFGGWNGSSALSDTWQWGPQRFSPPRDSLIGRDVQSDRVSLAWQLRNATGVLAEMQRRTSSGPWDFIGIPTRDSGDVVRFDDFDVTPGARYCYRLLMRANGDETLGREYWIDVPQAIEAPVTSAYSLALGGAQPNPTDGGPLNVAFSLARATDGRLELMDLAGRRVASRDLHALAPGQHRVVFSEAARVEPGVYLMRLVTKERTLTSKALITR